MEKYWEKEYTDIYKGVTFKFKQLNPIEHISLVTKNVDFERLDGDRADYFIKKCMECTLWSYDGKTFSPLITPDGKARLLELDENPQIALDMFYIFKRDVIVPVFYESKTFQNLTQAAQQADNK